MAPVLCLTLTEDVARILLPRSLSIWLPTLPQRMGTRIQGEILSALTCKLQTSWDPVSKVINCCTLLVRTNARPSFISNKKKVDCISVEDWQRICSHSIYTSNGALSMIDLYNHMHFIFSMNIKKLWSFLSIHGGFFQVPWGCSSTLDEMV
jgi:hypothetical protein